MKNEKGFTLVELLVAMAMGLIIMAAVYYTYASQQRSQVITETVTALQQNLRAGMFHLQKDIRMVGYNPTKSTVSFGFTDISATDSVTFTMDDDEDGALDADETITYARNPDDTLRKTVGAGGAQVISENITGLAFSFLDANGAATAVDADVRMVDITLSATSGDGNHIRQLRARINCRNMGL